MPELNLTGIETLDQNPDLIPQKKQEDQSSSLDLSGIEDAGITAPSKGQQKQASLLNLPSSSLTTGGLVRSGYGTRTFHGKTEFHDGIDIPTPLNTPLKPFGYGVVTFAGRKAGYGNSVEVEYGNGVRISVNHLNGIQVEEGDRVSPEAILGTSGNTGRSTGPHVHIKASKDGKSINPFDVFENDPKVDGLNLVLKGIIDDQTIVNPTKQPELDLQGVEQQGSKQTSLDLGGVAGISGQESQQQIDEQIKQTQPKVPDWQDLTFIPKIDKAEEEKTTTGMEKILLGVQRSSQALNPLPTIQNPNPPGKDLNIFFRNLPSEDDVIVANLRALGGDKLVELDKKFANEPRAKAAGLKHIISLTGKPTPISVKGTGQEGSGGWQVVTGTSKHLIDQINAYANGGIDAFVAKQQDIENQSKNYEEATKQRDKDIETFNQKYSYMMAEHGGGVLAMLPSPQAGFHGAEDVAVANMQFFHNLGTLPQALYNSSRILWDDSPEANKDYEDAVREDLKIQLEINKATASIPKETDFSSKIARGITGAALEFPRFAMLGSLGTPALPLMTYVENLNRGPRDAILAALPMVLMAGTGHGLEEFLRGEQSASAFFRNSKEANRDYITSISEKAPGNQSYLLAQNENIPLKTIDFRSLNPLERQLLLRGTNALTLGGTTAIISPDKNLQDIASQLIIGFALPVGKGEARETGRFERPSIITGDAYTMPDGSVLLNAPVSKESGLIQGRIPNEPVTEIHPFDVSTTKYLTLPAQVQGNITNISTGQRQVSIRESTKSILLDLDTAALNLLDLKRALANKSYLPETTAKTIGGNLKAENERRVALQNAINILDQAIPKDTQKFFEDNEQIIRDAIKQNYEDRVKKEEFIQGQKILRKNTSNLTPADSRPFSPTSSQAEGESSIQRMRRTLVSVEESGRRGLETNQQKREADKAKGVELRHSGIPLINSEDIPHYVQIAIGKLGRKGLDAVELSREMISEFGEGIKPYLSQIHQEAKGFIDGINSLSNSLVGQEGLKTPPFEVADLAARKNIFYIGTKYLTQAQELDVPVDKIIATQTGVRPSTLIDLAEHPELATKGELTDLPNLVKVNDDYYLYDGTHRSTIAKLKGQRTLRGRVIDFNEIASGNVQSRQERAQERFGETGSENKFFTQEKQMEVREDLFKPPSSGELQDVTSSAKFFAQQSANLVQIVGFHVEDFYRRGIEPKLDEILGRLRKEFGDWVDKVPIEEWQKTFDNAKAYYQANNADPFFSGMKQEALEKLPNRFNVQQARAILQQPKFQNEFNWTTGLDEWLEGKKGEKISRDDLIDFINQNQVRVEEKQLGIRNPKNLSRLAEIDNRVQAINNELKLDVWGNSELNTTNPNRYKQLSIEKRDLALEANSLTNNESTSTRYGLQDYSSEQLELQGGKNYKEMILTSPIREFPSFEDWLDQHPETKAKYESGNEVDKTFIAAQWNREGAILEGGDVYTSPHWPDKVKNPLGHYRTNERTTTDGKDILFGEEFQSDWNQEGRKRGYRASPQERVKLEQEYQDVNTKVGQIYNQISSIHEQGIYYSEELANLDNEGIRLSLRRDEITTRLDNTNAPQNPFMESNWKELLFKRFLRQGVEEGNDGVGWTTSRQQQERYHKIIQTKKLSYIKQEDGLYSIGAYDNTHGWLYPTELNNVTLEQAKQYIGEEFTDLIKRDSAYKAVMSKGEVDGSQIELRNKGYSGYDTEFVNMAKKIGKRFGARYSSKEIEIPDNIYSNLEGQQEYQVNPEHRIYEDENKVKFDQILAEGGHLFGEDLGNGERNFVISQEYEPFIYKNKPNKIEIIHFLEITPSMKESLLKEGQPLYGTSGLEPLKPSQPIGTRNRIITRDFYDKTKDDLTKSIQDSNLINTSNESSGTVLNTGLNPDAFLDQVRILFKTTKEITDFTRSLVSRFGESIRPYAERIFNWIQDSTSSLKSSWDKAIEDFSKAETPIGKEEERGSFSLRPSRRRLKDTTELDEFEKDKTSTGRKISLILHRGIALAQTYQSASDIYESVRQIQRITNAYSTTIINQLGIAIKFLRTDKDSKVAQAIFARNQEQVDDPNEDTNIVTRFALTPEQEQAYYHIRGAMQNVLNLRRDTLLYGFQKQAKKLNDDLQNFQPGTKEHDAILQKMGDLSDNIDKLNKYYDTLQNSGYISLQRLGRFRAEAINTDFPIGDERRILVDFTDTPEKAQQRINDWRAQYGASKVTSAKVLDAHSPEEFAQMARKLTPAEFEELVAESGANIHAADVEKIRAEVYEKYPSMGYNLKRKFYEGYPRTNEFVIKSISHQADVYSSSYYSKIAREEGLNALEDSGLLTSDKELYTVLRRYIEDETSAPKYSLFDKAAFKGRKLAFYWQLAGDVKQLWLNAVIQPITLNYNYLARVENPLNGKRLGNRDVERIFWKDGSKLVGKLTKEALGRKALQTPEYQEFKDIYNRLKLEQVIAPQFTKSLLELEAETAQSVANRKLGGSLARTFSQRQIEHWAGSFMRAGEATTRTKMAADMFLVGKKFGLDGEQLVSFIVRGIDATQSNPTRAENPLLVRSSGETGKLFYQFGAFRHMWFENLALNIKSDFKNRSVAATSRQLAPLAIISGLKGLPLTGFAFLMYSLITGNNPDKKIRKRINNNLLENIALYGITTSASFSQAAGIEAPLVDRTIPDALTSQNSITDTLISSNIPALMTSAQIARGFKQIAEGAYDHDKFLMLRGLETGAPKVLRNPLKAYRITREGQKTPSGTTIISKSKIVNSIPQKILVYGTQGILGITPNPIIEEYENQKYKTLKHSSLGKGVRRLIKKI